MFSLGPTDYPLMKHVADYVDRTSPLALIQCSARTGKKKLIPGTQDFVPDLHGNLNAVLSQTRYTYLIESVWPGKHLKHVLLFDAERGLLNMGRCGKTTKQTILRPCKDDCLDPHGRLKEEFDFDFTIESVWIVLVKTNRLAEIPLAALCDSELRAKKQRKREQYEAVVKEEGTADAAIPGLLSELKTTLDANVGKGKGKRFDIAAEFMIGRTLDTHAAHANPKSGHYYGPHSIEEYIAKGTHVYMRDPQKGTKDKWLKDAFGDILTPLIQAIDPEWAGTDGDWAVQINVINSAKQSIKRHVDKDDIAPQYGLALGEFEGGELTIWSKDESSKQSIDLRNRIVRLDGRNFHQVEPVTSGTRYSVYFFKGYDRRWTEKQPHTDEVKIVYNGQAGNERPAKRACCA